MNSGNYAILQTKFQASKPSGSKDEDFLSIFYFQPKTLCHTAVLDPGATISTY